MPRLEKIRLVGIQYDSMRKHYEDTTLDLMNGTEPAHTLLTLMNGGGKGLLLQMIFQLLLPLSKWGAKGENRIEALFYNERKQFVPYTFHVALEWRLDTDPVKWLMTGIAISAREKASAAEAEFETAEPRYMLYTLEQMKPGRYEIEDLPLYDKEKRGAASLDEWKEYTAARRSDFTTYSQSQTKDYFELLKSYDIDRKEWETLRNINRQEGGVKAFFHKGQDNRSLFHELIIPEIGKHMTGTDEEGHTKTLLEIFKSNAAIAQHLPKLMKREEGYRLLLQALEPVMQSLEQGAGLERQEREQQQEGAQLRHAMKEWHGEQLKEQKQWQSEQERAEAESRNLRWREDNLGYAEKHREVAELERQLAESGKELAQKALRLELSVKGDERARAIVLWNERELSRQRASELRQELELLQNAEENRQVRAEQERVQGELREGWLAVSSGWSASLKRYGLLSRRLERERRQAERQSKDVHEALRANERKLGGVTGLIKALNAEMLEMERAFGRMAVEAPERLVEQHVKQLESLQERLKGLQKEKQAAEQEKERLLILGAGMQAELEQLNSSLKRMDEELQRRLEREKQLAWRLQSYLKQETGMDSVTLSQSWFTEEKKKLSREMERLESQLQLRQQQVWTLQLDSSLAKEAYWIPNGELNKVKGELDKQGISSYYGTELLASMNDREMEEQLGAYPLLPYSLVVLQAEWRKRDAQQLSRLLLRSPVPIYLREQMASVRGSAEEREAGSRSQADARYNDDERLLGGAFLLRDGALLLQDEGTELVKSREQWQQWKAELVSRNEELLSQMSLLKEQLELGRELEQAVKELLASPDSRALRQSLQEQMEERSAKERQWREAEEAEKLVSEHLTALGTDLLAASGEADECKAKLSRLEAWGKRLEQGRVWQEQKRGLEGEIRAKEEEHAELAKRLQALGDELHAWSRAFDKWEKEQSDLLQQLKRFEPQASFSFRIPATDAGEEVPSKIKAETGKADDAADAAGASDVSDDEDLFTANTSALKLLLKELDALSTTLEEKDKKLTEVRIHLHYANDDAAAKEKELGQAYPGWEANQLPLKPLEIARSEHVASMHERKDAEREHNAADKQHSRLDGKLEAERKSLEKQGQAIYKKHNREADAWAEESLDRLRAELEEAMQRNRSHLAECRKLLDEIGRIIGNLDTQLKVLASQRISSQAVFDLPAEVRRAVRFDAAGAAQQWMDKQNLLLQQKRKLDERVAGQRNQFIQLIRDGAWDADLRESLQGMMGQIRWDEYSYARDLLQSIKDHALFELDSLSEDMSKAEQARDMWTDRAAYRVISISKALRQMTNRMSFVNQGGHRYPLVRMDVRGGELPEKPEEISLLLREYFVRTIDELSAAFPDISDVPDAELDKRMSDSQIVFTALKSRYPTLLVYKPQTTNVFLFESPKKHHYTEWETLNKGSVTEAKGSGGQLLAARTIVMMMLMTHKRQLRQTKMWSVLILDNPFGQAVSPHILDPIFAIAENLHFQWIVLAPPELIKLDVSRRFPVFWELELKREQQGETVTERLQHGGRTFEGEFDLFSSF